MAMDKKQINEFVKQMKEIVKLAEDSFKQEKRRFGEEKIKFDKEQQDELDEAKKSYVEYQKYLADLNNSMGENTYTADLITFSKQTNEALQRHISFFEEHLKTYEPHKGSLPYINLSDETKEELARALAFHLEMIEIDLKNLELIAKMTEAKFDTKNPFKKHDKDLLDDLGKKLYNDKNKDPFSLIDKFNNFLKTTIKRIGDLVQALFRTAPAVIPKDVAELTRLDKKTMKQHYEGSETETDATIVGKLALAQHKKKNPERDKQMDIFVNTIAKINELNTENGQTKNPDANDKKRLKGCLLFIKHQIESEWNLFDSRMLATVNGYLKTSDLNVEGFRAKDCVDAFDHFANTYSAEIGINPTTQKKINKTLADNSWLDHEDNITGLHQRPSQSK